MVLMQPARRRRGGTVNIETLTPEEIALAAVKAVEDRDLDTLDQLYHPDVRFEWPPGLPYSGRFQGASVDEMTQRFAAVWEPLQPTDDEKRMDATVVASSGNTVVVEYTWRSVDQRGHRFETSTLARYEVRDGRFAGARMYYSDHAGLLAFLRDAGVELSTR
jgi:ketosteroid isomerase-like protein